MTETEAKELAGRMTQEKYRRQKFQKKLCKCLKWIGDNPFCKVHPVGRQQTIAEVRKNLMTLIRLYTAILILIGIGSFIAAVVLALFAS